MEIGARGFLRGNAVTWDGSTWRTADGRDATACALRCPRCDVDLQPGDPDACIGVVEGIAGACCGHDVHLGYVNWAGIGVGSEWQHGAFVGARE